MSAYHLPVLLQEVVECLNVLPGKKYIDATMGGGGHGLEILKRGGVILGIDQDPDAIRSLEFKIQNSEFGKNITLVQGNFRDIKKIAEESGFENVFGVLFDLGMSSYQIEKSGRGFSFNRPEPLDMRMNSSVRGISAGDIVNTWTQEELYEIFSKIGEETNARAISDGIVRARRAKKIATSLELAKLIEGMVQRRGKIHPATRIFMALRIVVNDELGALKTALRASCELLDVRGRVAVISFHSGEDRVVKSMFRDFENKGLGRVITHKLILAAEEERERNARARSAKMRVFERTKL